MKPPVHVVILAGSFRGHTALVLSRSDGGASLHLPGFIVNLPEGWFEELAW